MSAVTVDRLEKSLFTLAYIVTKHGEKYAPLFERIEKELEIAKARSDSVSRAAQMLSSYNLDGGRKQIFLR